MNRNTSFRVAVTGACSLAALTLLQCNQDTDVLAPPIPPPSHGGSYNADASLGDGGSGGGTSTEPVITFNLDLPPVSWAIEDAPQGPEVLPPSLDSNCGIIAKETVRKPADVMLVLDASLSMDFKIDEDCYCSTGATGTGGRGGGFPGIDGGFGFPTTPMGRPCADTKDCKTRMEGVKPAISATLADSTYVNWGLKLFPTDGNNSCGVSNAMEVPVGTDSAEKIKDKLENMELYLGTPTALAISRATDYLKTLTDGNKKFILLATDGEPNCADGDLYESDVEGASAAAAAAKAAGFPVYVVGIGPNLENLTSIASGGGTEDYYPVSSPEQLVEALSSITKIVGSCTYKSDSEPPDSENVAVYVNKKLIEKSEQNGWVYGDTTMDIKLTGSYCEAITAGEDTAVQILFGCPGAPPFPTEVP